MGMTHGLPGRFPAIDSDIESRYPLIGSLNLFSELFYQLFGITEFSPGHPEEIIAMAIGDDQHVARTDR